MWKLLFALAALALGSLPAQAADQGFVLATCGTPTGATYNIPGYGPLSLNQNGQLCVSGTFSAAGFTPSATGATGTPLAVTNTSGTGTLPTGAVVILTNAGTTTAYCALGATATTSSQPIVGGGSFAFTVGSATQFSCITASGTTTINSLGGSGTPAFSGGGGGSGLSVTDGATFTASSSSFTPSGGEYNSSPTTLTSGKQGTPPKGEGDAPLPPGEGSREAAG